jgi:hypothetical protein
VSQPLLRPAIEPTHVGSINLFLVPSVLRLNLVEIIPTVTHVDTAQTLQDRSTQQPIFNGSDVVMPVKLLFEADAEFGS